MGGRGREVAVSWAESLRIRSLEEGRSVCVCVFPKMFDNGEFRDRADWIGDRPK